MYILFPCILYIASLGEYCHPLTIGLTITFFQLPELVFLSQWVKLATARWYSLNCSVVGFQVSLRSLLQRVPPVPVSFCCSTNWIEDLSHNSNDRFENMVSQ